MPTLLPNRQSIRKRGWDYTSARTYFVTINTHESRALFGAIVNGRMVLSEAGRMVAEVWKNMPQFYSGMGIDEAVVMPNQYVLAHCAPNGCRAPQSRRDAGVHFIRSGPQTGDRVFMSNPTILAKDSGTAVRSCGTMVSRIPEATVKKL